MKKIGIIITDPNDWTARALVAAAKDRGFIPVALDLRAAEAAISTGVVDHLNGFPAGKGPADKGKCPADKGKGPADKGKGPISEVPSNESFSDISFRSGGCDFSGLDAVVVRDVGAGAFEGVSFRFDILRELEAEGIPVINSPAAVQNTANKYHASYLLAKAGLPVPETVAVQNACAAREVISRFGDALIKPVFGYKGKDIVRFKAGEVMFSDRESGPVSWDETVEKLLEERGMLYVQKFIPNPGRDIRAFVVDGTAIGAIYRKAAPGSWVNNLSQGGSADRCTLTEEQKAIAEKAARAVGTVFAGVDILEPINPGPTQSIPPLKHIGQIGPREGENAGSGSPDKRMGTQVLEVNGTPSGKGIFDAWRINPAEHIIDYLKNIL